MSPQRSDGNTLLLVVDDADDLRESTAKILRDAGYAVCQANSARQALAVWAGRGGEIDLVISDISMPGGSGEKLAADLLKMRPDLKIVFTSGYTAEFLGYEPARTHKWFLSKPWTIQELLDTVRQCLYPGPAKD